MIEGAVHPEVDINPESLLGPPMTGDYVPQAVYGMYGYVGLMNRHRPPFSYLTIRDMLCDPRVGFGLMLLKGPIIANPTYVVECEDATVTTYLEANIKRFWNIAALRVMKALEWGFSPHEILYRRNPSDGLIYFDDVRDLEPLDCRPVVLDGRVVGFTYRQGPDPHGNSIMTNKDQTPGVQRDDPRSRMAQDGWHYLGAPKALWHIHNRERNPWFGLSRLFGAHVPWHEMWSEDGYRNIRKLWFFGCAFDGGIMYHPPGMVATEQGPKPARDYAREMIQKKRTGSVLTLPNSPTGDGGEQAWIYQKPEGNPTPAGLMEYGEDLRNEMFEALGIPPEVIQSSGETGFGSASGRQVPQMAYHAILHSLAQSLLLDFDKYCLRYLVHTQFGPVPYELSCEPLGSVQQHPNDPNGDALGDEEPQVDENGEPIPPDDDQDPADQPPPR